MANQVQRLLALAAIVQAGGVVTTETIRDRYGVSRATAKRDAAALDRFLGHERGARQRRVIAAPNRRTVWGVAMGASE